MKPNLASTAETNSVVKKKYARTKETAAYIGLSESFLNKSRLTGDGPPHISIGSAVIYDLDAVDEWLAARVRRSTTRAVGDR